MSSGDQSSHVHVLCLKASLVSSLCCAQFGWLQLMVCTDGHRTAWSSSLFFGEWEPCQVFPFWGVLPNNFSHSIPLVSMTGTSSYCCAWRSHGYSSPEVHSALRKGKRSTQLLSHLLQTAGYPVTLYFQKAPSHPPRSLSPATELGFGTSQTLKVSVCVCVVATGKSKGRPKVPLQPQHRAEEIHLQDES